MEYQSFYFLMKMKTIVTTMIIVTMIIRAAIVLMMTIFMTIKLIRIIKGLLMKNFMNAMNQDVERNSKAQVD